MRVGLVASTYYNAAAGVPLATLQLAEALVGVGVEARALFLDDVPGIGRSRFKELLFPWYLSRRPFAHAFDVLDVASGDGWLVSLRPNRPVVVCRSHGLEHVAHLETVREVQRTSRWPKSMGIKYHLYRGGFRLLEVAASLRLADHAIFLNQGDRAYAIGRLGVAPGRTSVIANGLPDRIFADLRMDQVRDDIGIAIIGSFVDRKGFQYAIPALVRILNLYANVYVGLFGVGVDKDVVLKPFEAGIRRRVTVVPRFEHDQLPSLLRQFHIFLLASLSEGLPLSLLEAMAFGLAPVCTDLAAMTEVVQDGVTGILVPPRNVDAIVVALERLINNRGCLEALRLRAQASVRCYRWSAIARRTADLYAEALALRKLAVRKRFDESNFR